MAQQVHSRTVERKQVKFYGTDLVIICMIITTKAKNFLTPTKCLANPLSIYLTTKINAPFGSNESRKAIFCHDASAKFW